VPIFVYRCECGQHFERLTGRDAAAPPCPECGGATRKVPAAPSLGRGAGPAGPAPGPVPVPWRGVLSGGPEKMRREVEFRQRLEAKAVGGLRTPGSPDSAGSPGDRGPT
jgi:putative FmdB family regulatory protein